MRKRFALGTLSLAEVHELLRLLRAQGCLRVRKLGGEEFFSARAGARVRAPAPVLPPRHFDV